MLTLLVSLSVLGDDPRCWVTAVLLSVGDSCHGDRHPVHLQMAWEPLYLQQTSP